MNEKTDNNINSLRTTLDISLLRRPTLKTPNLTIYKSTSHYEPSIKKFRIIETD